MGENNISVTPATFAKLRAEADRRGCTISKLISEMLDVAEAAQNSQRRLQSR